jgi:hypothetical protein
MPQDEPRSPGIIAGLQLVANIVAFATKYLLSFARYAGLCELLQSLETIEGLGRVGI